MHVHAISYCYITMYMSPLSYMYMHLYSTCMHINVMCVHYGYIVYVPITHLLHLLGILLILVHALLCFL